MPEHFERENPSHIERERERESAMELQSTKPNARVRRTEKLSLDQYLSFIHTHKQADFTVNILNQIIDMHGFKKIHRTSKKVLIDAVNSIDLMDPSRSTLSDENVSSCALMTLEEAIMDLADLNWQECSVTSIQTINSVNYDLVEHNADDSSSKPKPKRSRKRLKFLTRGANGGDGDATAATHGCGDIGGSQSVCSSAAVGEGCGATNLITEGITNLGNDSDFGATAGDCSEYSSTFLSIAPY